MAATRRTPAWPSGSARSGRPESPGDVQQRAAGGRRRSLRVAAGRDRGEHGGLGRRADAAGAAGADAVDVLAGIECSWRTAGERENVGLGLEARRSLTRDT